MIKNAFLKNKKQVINAMQSQKPIIQQASEPQTAESQEPINFVEAGSVTTFTS